MSESLREQLSKAYDQVEAPVEETVKDVETTAEERARDAEGKFVKAEKTENTEKAKAPAKTAAAPLADAVVTPATPERPKPPSSWKKDYWSHWDKLDPQLAAYINQRESEYAKGVSTYKTEWDKAKPILDAITPYAQEFQKYGVKPEQWIQNLGAAHQALALGNPQQKLQMFAKLAHDYGVPLQALMPRQPQLGPDGQPLPQQQPAIDPRVAAWLQQQFGTLKQEITQFKTQQQQQQAAQIQKEIDSFAANHPHYEAIKGTMADLIDKGLANDLQNAHDLALRMPQHDDIVAAEREEKRKAEEARKAQEAATQAARARKNAVSVKSSSPGAGAAAGEGKKGLRDTLSQAFDNVTANRV